MKVTNQGLPGCFTREIKQAIIGDGQVRINGDYIHREHRYYRQHKRLLQKTPDLEDKIIVFVNHPYDRFCYYWNQIMTVGDLPEGQGIPLLKLIKGYLKDYTDLNDFLENGEEQYLIINELSNSPMPVFRSMSYFCEGEWDIYDNIYNCTDIDNELSRMINDYSITVEGGLQPISVPTIMTTPFDPANLTQVSKDFIYEKHKPDFDQFGFTR